MEHAQKALELRLAETQLRLIETQMAVLQYQRRDVVAHIRSMTAANNGAQAHDDVTPGAPAAS